MNQAETARSATGPKLPSPDKPASPAPAPKKPVGPVTYTVIKGADVFWSGNRKN